VTWVDTSKLKRTVMAYNDEVRAVVGRERVRVLTALVARRLRSALSACMVYILYWARPSALHVASRLIAGGPLAPSTARSVHNELCEPKRGEADGLSVHAQ
jgi:hypothetical protein